MNAVLAEFEALLGKLSATKEGVEASFTAAVQRSLKDTDAVRARRLAAADPTPATMVVQTTVFVRNPDVVAAALVRAAGMCEGCMRPAPFLRRKDGKPYLEVHHRRPLAKGGKDTLDNAATLCPNCHRQAHHG
jgi:5-methylcytosine-specific restriction protein A